MNHSDKSKGQLSRRIFFRSAGLGTAVLAGMPVLAGPYVSVRPAGWNSKLFSTGDTLLFQGDSITDAGREKKRELPNYGSSFGNGYAFIIAAWLLEEMASKGLTVYNRGISGNKVFQLAERWEKDCLELKPDVLSILIGVNDYWHKRQGRYEGTPEIYETDYRDLLTRTRETLPGIKLVICEPFILPETKSVDETWIEPFKSYQEIAGKMAKEFDAAWVPFQKVFNEALEVAPATYWTPDGVHPSMAGAQLMAEAWLDAVN